MDLSVVEVSPAAVRTVRHEVLRPHQPPTAVVYPGDGHPDIVHLGAVTDDGRVVAVGSVYPDPPPWDPAASGAWRLRGMATVDGMRGRGIGAHLLDTALAHIAARGGRLLWCNARSGAVAFYRRAGFATRGDPFIEPESGVEHVVMWRSVPPPR